jgi:hypothetical protein
VYLIKRKLHNFCSILKFKILLKNGCFSNEEEEEKEDYDDDDRTHSPEISFFCNGATDIFM